MVWGACDHLKGIGRVTEVQVSRNLYSQFLPVIGIRTPPSLLLLAFWSFSDLICRNSLWILHAEPLLAIGMQDFMYLGSFDEKKIFCLKRSQSITFFIYFVSLLLYFLPYLKVMKLLSYIFFQRFKNLYFNISFISFFNSPEICSL